MFKGVLRLGSELPLPSVVGVFGVQDGELGTDTPRESGCEDEPDGTEEMSGLSSIQIIKVMFQKSQTQRFRNWE